MASTINSTVGALPPPPGVTPNFVNPHSILPPIEAVNSFLVALISITTFIYIFARYFILREGFWNFDTLILAYCSFIAYYAIARMPVKYGPGRHQWNVPLTDMQPIAYWGFIAELFYFVCIASVRIALSLQFKRLFSVGHDERFWATTIFIFVNMVYYTSQFFVSLFQCTPIAKAWRVELTGYCFTTDLQRLFIVTGVFNMIGDVLMLIFPLYCVWNLCMTRARRLATGGLFFVGIFATVASILRTIFSVANNGSQDTTYYFVQLSECTGGEISAGLLVATLVWAPDFFNVAGTVFKSLVTSLKSSSYCSGEENPSNAPSNQLENDRILVGTPSELHNIDLSTMNSLRIAELDSNSTTLA